LEESGDEKAGGRERKREEERTGWKSTYSGRISLCIWPEIRPGVGFGQIRSEIQPSALDLTSVMSPTPCPDLVVPFPSPLSVAGRREKKKNEREREREGEMRSREIFFFFLKGERSSSFFLSFYFYFLKKKRKRKQRNFKSSGGFIFFQTVFLKPSANL
jgi:hypothetical protein